MSGAGESLTIGIGHIVLLSDTPLTEAQWFGRVFGWPIHQREFEDGYVKVLTATNRLAWVTPQVLKQFAPIDAFLNSMIQPGMLLSLNVPDLDRLLHLIQDAEGTILQGKTLQPWGQWTAFIQTPGGRLLELCQPAA